MTTRLVYLPIALALLACRSSAGGDARPSPSTSSASVDRATQVGSDPGHAGDGSPLVAAPGHELAAFAEGCFWGSEDTFRHVAGVTATAVGYAGGHTKSPSYEDVCSHTTGHAETVLVEFDPTKVTYRELLDVFWRSHDPTTLNRQGPDVGDSTAARSSHSRTSKRAQRSVRWPTNRRSSTRRSPPRFCPIPRSTRPKHITSNTTKRPGVTRARSLAGGAPTGRAWRPRRAPTAERSARDRAPLSLIPRRVLRPEAVDPKRSCDRFRTQVISQGALYFGYFGYPWWAPGPRETA